MDVWEYTCTTTNSWTHSNINLTWFSLFYQLDKSIFEFKGDGFHSNFKSTCCKVTVQNLIRCCVMRRPIWFCTVCQWPIKWMLGLYYYVLWLGWVWEGGGGLSRFTQSVHSVQTKLGNILNRQPRETSIWSDPQIKPQASNKTLSSLFVIM